MRQWWRLPVLMGPVAVAIIIAFYPGTLNNDGFTLFRHINYGEVTDWLSPSLALLWSIPGLLVPGPGLVLVLQVLVFMTAAWTVLASVLPRGEATLATAGLALWPPTLGYLGVVGADSTLGIAALAGFAAVVALQRHPTWPAWQRRAVATLSLLAFVVGMAARYNAVVALVPLLALWIAQIRPAWSWRRVVPATAVLTAALFAALVAMSERVMHPAHEHPVQQVLIFDLVGMSIDAEEMLVPKTIAGDHGLAELRKIFWPSSVDTLFWGPPELPSLARVSDDEAMRELWRTWRHAIMRHPGSYLRVRWAMFHGALGLRDDFVGQWTYQPAQSATSDYPPAHPSWSAAASAYLGFARGAWFYRPVFTLALNLLIAALAWRRKQSAWLALSVGALAYHCHYFFVAPSENVRYVWYPMVCAVVGATWAIVEHREHITETRAAWAIVAVTALVIAVSFYPGIINWDGAAQFHQIKTAHYDDWYSPSLTFLWSPSYRLVHGPGLVLTLQVIACVMSLFAVFGAVMPRLRASVVTAVVCAWPPVLGYYMGVVGADSSMGVAALCGVAAVVAYRRRLSMTTTCRNIVSVVALLSLLATLAARYNAIFAVVPLLTLWFANAGWRWRRTLIASVVVAVTALIGLTTFATVTLHPQRQHPVQQVLIFDLVGVSLEVGENLLPAPIAEDRTVDELRPLFWPTSVNPLFWGTSDRRRLQRVNGDDEMRDLWQSWATAIARHPASYLRVRATMFAGALGMHRGFAKAQTYQPPRENETAGFAIANPSWNSATIRYREAARAAWFYRPFIYLLLNCGVAFVAWRSRRSEWLALAVSALAYQCHYFFVAPSENVRYAWYPMLAAIVGSICALIERRRVS